MALSIDWLTYVITIPKADMSIISASPEIRELDVNAFRLELKDIEDSEEGAPFWDTHAHNTAVSLSGIVYARIVEILSPYTVEFEDGQYTVSCTSANHNLADVKVANQVSLIIGNAAGLIEDTANDTVVANTELLRKLLNNRQDVVESGGAYYLITYDDDDVTPLRTSLLNTISGGVPVIDADAIAQRGRGT
ncbi:MAG: hypothetical protein ACXABY_01090 [Candidatus Thorarchaeota archaeon]|jgi:hypothetical protein